VWQRKSRWPRRFWVDMNDELAHSLNMDTAALTKILRRTAEQSGLENLLAAASQPVDEQAVVNAMLDAQRGVGATVATRKRGSK